PSSHSYVNNFPSLENQDSFHHLDGIAQFPSDEQLPNIPTTGGFHYPSTGDHFPAPVVPGGEGLTPANRHMIHVHLIPHLYVPIMKTPGESEDHKIQENHYQHQHQDYHPPQHHAHQDHQDPKQDYESIQHHQAPQQQDYQEHPQHQDVSNSLSSTSGETNQSLDPPPPRGEKHIEENHIIENHYDEFGNPYDPNQSVSGEEDDEGEITNVDIHTYSSDDQGGSSHTHYTKNDGGSHESFEQTSPSGVGELSVDHGAQSSSYENSNSYYTIPPDVNIQHYNMHREYDHLLSKEPNLHDLTEYKPKPIILNQYEVHENTEEDTSNNNLGIGSGTGTGTGPVQNKPSFDSVPNKPSFPQLPQFPSAPNHPNEIKTIQLNSVSSGHNTPNKKFQYGKHYVKQLLDNKHGKLVSNKLPASSLSLGENNQNHHDFGMKNINTQLQHNLYSPNHYTFARAPAYVLDQAPMGKYTVKPVHEAMTNQLNIQTGLTGSFPLKTITINNEKLPGISLGEKVHIRTNPKFLNHFNNRVQMNGKAIRLNSMKPLAPSAPSVNALINQAQENSYFKSKDYLKPLYNFQNIPELQPLFKADSSNKNFNMVKLKPTKIAEYATYSPTRQTYVQTLIMSRKDDFRNMESLRPPPPAQKETWDRNYSPSPWKQIIPDSYAKITLPKSIYHLNLIKTPMLSSKFLDQTSVLDI
ncbi:hypothetical protein WDU94_001113, partial [Cyamophila willieti]